MALVLVAPPPALFCSHPGPFPSPPLPFFSRASRLVCSCKPEEFLPSSSSSSSSSPAAAVVRRGRNWRRTSSVRSSSSESDSNGNGSGFEFLIRELGNARSAKLGAGARAEAKAAAGAEDSGRLEAPEKKKPRRRRRSIESSRRRLVALSLLAVGLGTVTTTGNSKNGPSTAVAAEELRSAEGPVVGDLDDDDDNDADDIKSPSGVIVDKFPEKIIEKQIIGDVFGFDGLGKLPEEYALGKVVALAQAGDGAVVFLGVDGFELPLQLVVGPAEAMAVLTAVQERKSRRPVTHEAWGLSLAAVGWKVDRVVITGNEKDIFYSNVVLSNLSQLLSSATPAGMKSVDMRPSDGIALALRCRAPLFVRRKVAEDILGSKADLPPGKVQVDPLLKQPGLQADNGNSSTTRGSSTSVILLEKKSVPVGFFTSPHGSSGFGPWTKKWTSFLTM